MGEENKEIMEQENTNSFMFKNSGKYDREDSVLFINTKITSAGPNGLVFDETNPEWTPIGEDNDEITRTTNNEIESKKNVLGKNNITHTAGAETTEIDPIAMEKISQNDKKRIMRILEIYKATGKTKTMQEFLSRQKDLKYDYKMFVVNIEREKLYEKINKRK